MNVLSLFDGMSCGQIALRELGIPVENYFASEIDRHAIAQTQLNFPDTIQLGSVTGVKAKDLPKIDLLIGGSPCQGFSLAGKRLNFNDPRSSLFFEYVRILNELREINPDIKFLLENVRMARRCKEAISDCLGGLYPVTINSALVSAQHRVRLYWCNIRTAKVNLFGDERTDIPQPADRGIFLRDILEDEVDERYHMKDTVLRNLLRHKERNERMGRGFGMVVRTPDEKSLPVRVSGKYMYDFIKLNRHGQMKRDQTKASTLTVGGHGSGNHGDMDIILQRPRGDKGLTAYTDKSPTLTANAWEQNNLLCRPTLCSSRRGPTAISISEDDILRRLTPTECARLQTIPDWYKWDCSETQQYKMLGNGWTVAVIMHIFKSL